MVPEIRLPGQGRAGGTSAWPVHMSKDSPSAQRRGLRCVVAGGVWWWVEVAPSRDTCSCRIRENLEVLQGAWRAGKDAKEQC